MMKGKRAKKKDGAKSGSVVGGVRAVWSLFHSHTWMQFSTENPLV